MKSNRQMGATETNGQAGSDVVQAALRASDEIVSSLQAHLTQERGAHVEDRS